MDVETPPRMRGRLLKALMEQESERNTPAHAGKTFTKGIWDAVGEKHPRACGEDYTVGICCNEKTETPPRMRGRQNVASISIGIGGNTPAHAGKTQARLEG